MAQRIFKTYSIEQSPLYRLRNKRKLAASLGVTLADIKRLCSDSNYCSYESRKPGKKPRTIQAPSKELKRTHRQLKKLFARIETPEWLISGKRGKSYVDNAKIHEGARYLLKVDVHNFYESCKREFVVDLFKRTFLMADDVALLAADFVTYKGFIPTGSPMSQMIAYWAYAPTFARIVKLAEGFGSKMSLYVDDLSFSSNRHISSELTYLIKLELNSVGLDLKKKKSRLYSPSEHKEVTGCVLSRFGGLKVPNVKRLAIKEILENAGDVTLLSLDDRRRLLGRLESARQIEPQFANVLYLRLRKTLEPI